MKGKSKHILKGAGSVLEIRPRRGYQFKSRTIVRRSDAKALENDWNAVGKDLTSTMKKLDPTHVD